MKTPSKSMTYECCCVKCLQRYQSSREMDTDGLGYCPSCKTEKDELVKVVNERVRTTNKREGVSLKDIPLIPGTNFIDYKNMYGKT